MKNYRNIALALLLAAAGLNAAVTTFQEGVNGYTGTFDTYLRGASPDQVHDEPEVSADGDDGGSPIDALIRFENIFGTGPGQIPPEASIISAQLVTFSVTANSQSGSTYGIYRMLVPWEETSTWNTMVGGVEPDEIEASSTADVTFIPNGSVPFTFTNDVTASVQAWHAGTPNHGWLINIVSGTDGFDFAASEYTVADSRPMLVVQYTGPLTNIVITQQPQSVTTNEGARVSLFVAASGDPRFQWFKDGAPLTDETNATLTFTNVTAADDGNYHVELNNDFPSSATSATATLTVIPDVTAPSIVLVYATSAFNVTVLFDEAIDPTSVESASGNWFFEGSDGFEFSSVAAATVNGNQVELLVVPELNPAVNYTATIFGATDVAAARNEMTEATVAVHRFVEAPVVTPDTVTVWKYNDSGIDQSANGWQNIGFDDSTWTDGFNGFSTPTGDTVADPDFAINTPTLPPPTGSHVVDYYRTVFPWGGGGSAAVAEITGAFDDGAVVYINGQEVARYRMPTTTIIGTTLATGQGSGDPVHELETPAFAVVTNLVEGDNVLAVEVHQNSTTSSDALMAIRLRLSLPELPSGPPVIRTQPAGATINEGGSHTFSVVADGAAPLTYQWRQGEVDIEGATSTSLTISNASPSDAGEYRVTVTNPEGNTTSDPAVLTVIADTTGPTMLQVIGETNLTTIIITFNEAVEPTGAETAGNYTVQLSGGGTIAVSSATLTNGTNVVLTLGEPMVPASSYTLTVTGVTDTAAGLNPVTPNSKSIAQTLILLAPTDNTIWRYNQTSNDLAGTGWQAVVYDDLTWESGLAGLATPTEEEVPPGYELRTTNLVAQNMGGPNTIYFRTHFAFPFGTTGATLAWDGIIDDGVVFYINGVEAGRWRMLGGPGPVSFTNDASNAANESGNVHTLEGPVLIDASGLQTGDNVLAVELHQAGTGSSDAVLSIRLIAYLDEFGAGAPRLNIERNPTTGLITISWSGTGFCLQETTALQGAETAWSPSLAVNGVPFAATGEAKFYRLISCP